MPPEEQDQEEQDVEQDDDDQDDEVSVRDSSIIEEVELSSELEIGPPPAHHHPMQEDDYQDNDDDDESTDEEEQDEVESDGSKSEGELESIQYEMQQLLETVPVLNGAFRLLSRLGEGTFSSVYKAVDLDHQAYDNREWVADDEGTTKPTGKVYVALKRIYVTSSPIRIYNELDILNDLRGASNVAYLISAIRHEDQVIAVMPFNRHQDFRTYYRTATLPLLRSYFACLFRALKATHDQSIIHRDVKPANFLYDRATATGVLCDFGLAQKIGGDEWYEWTSECLHSLPSPSNGGLGHRIDLKSRLEALTPGEGPGLASGLHGVRLLKPVSLWTQAQAMERDWRMSVLNEEGRQKPWMIPSGLKAEMKSRDREKTSWFKNWTPGTAGTSSGKRDRPGYLIEDRRPSVRANRAGTRGFRAPEVLLKCPDQTVALDVWSSGIILLCFLTRRFPFFNSNDDTEALVEIAAIFGKKKIEKCALSHNRNFITNVPTLETPPHPSLHALVKSLNPPIVVENSPNPYGAVPSLPESDAEWYEGSELYFAVDFMKRCLELEGTRRWTAEELLGHEFLKGEMDKALS